MADDLRNGNDERTFLNVWDRFRDYPVSHRVPSYRKAGLMKVSLWKRSAPFALAAAIVLATSPGHAASFDGPWTVTIVTQSGNCDAAYSFPLQVSGGRVSSAGGATMSGRISSGGGVNVSISSGGSSGRASGRLAGYSGSGRWSGVLNGARCSGRWEAHR